MALWRLPMFLECSFYVAGEGKGEERVGHATALWNPHHHLAGKKKGHHISHSLPSFGSSGSPLFRSATISTLSTTPSGALSCVVCSRRCLIRCLAPGLLSDTQLRPNNLLPPSPLPPVAYQTLRYPPYTKAELNEISKAQTARDGVVYSDMAIELCGRKVAKASGDVRAAMDKLESLRMADARSRAATALATGAGGGAALATTEGGGGERAGPIVIGSDLRQVSRVLSRSVNSKTAQIRAIAALPVHQQYVLVAAVREVGDEGRTITRGQSGQKGAFELWCGNVSLLGAWEGRLGGGGLSCKEDGDCVIVIQPKVTHPLVCLSSSRACK